MISRVADCCFWITRYLERVDTMARLLGVSAEFHLDSSEGAVEHWKPLVIVAGAEEDFVARVGADYLDDAERVQDYLTWDREQSVSIYASLSAARENARIIRDVLSLEMWEQINDLWLWMNERAARNLYARDRDSFYDYLSKQCMLFHGIAYSTMLHEEPFVFMKLGRALERVGQTARILDVKHHGLGDTPRDRETTDDAAVWLAILRSCSAAEPFFKSATNALTGPKVLEFLLFEESFPRSVVHNLDRTRGLMLRGLIQDPQDTDRASWRLLERFRGELVQMEVEDVLQLGVHKVLTWIVDSQTDLCTAIHDDFLEPSMANASTPAWSSLSARSQEQSQH